METGVHPLVGDREVCGMDMIVIMESHSDDEQ